MKDNKNPLQQIREKEYYVKYKEKERNITSFEWEKLQ